MKFSWVRKVVHSLEKDVLESLIERTNAGKGREGKDYNEGRRRGESMLE